MKKKIFVTTLTLFGMTLLTACGHEHTFSDATCTIPMTCSECGITEGNALGHTWVEATCDTAKTCSVCGTTEGNPLEHSWIEATTEAPKTCELCGLTEGEPIAPTEEEEVVEEETTETTEEETQTEENQSSFQWPDEAAREWFRTEFNLSEDELNNMTQERYDSLIDSLLHGGTGGGSTSSNNGGSNTESDAGSDDDIPWGEVPPLDPNCPEGSM